MRTIKFSDYQKEQFQNDEDVVAYINTALEEYLIDHNKELFLAMVHEVIDARSDMDAGTASEL